MLKFRPKALEGLFVSILITISSLAHSQMKPARFGKGVNFASMQFFPINFNLDPHAFFKMLRSYRKNKRKSSIQITRDLRDALSKSTYWQVIPYSNLDLPGFKQLTLSVKESRVFKVSVIV